MVSLSYSGHSPGLTIRSRYLLAILSGAMSSVAFLNNDLYLFAWICFVPMLFAISGGSLRHAYFIGLTAGLINFSSSTYWIMDFVELSKGYRAGPAFLLSVLYWFYSAQIFALTAILFHWITRVTQISPLIVFPVVIVGIFASYPMLFPYRMGESQIAFLEILQGIELTGVWGLDMLIALFNVLAFCLLKSISANDDFTFLKKPLLNVFIPITLLLAWYVYGNIALSNWQSSIEHWPKQKVGLVQPNETPSTERDKLYPGYTRGYPPEMAMTEMLVSAGAEFVIWPEARYKGVMDYQYVEEAYLSHMERLDVPLMFQDIEEINTREGNQIHTSKFNTALMIVPGSDQIQYYQKMKLIPFGETIPFVSDHFQFHSWLESFLGEFLNEMTAGQSQTQFEVGPFNVVPLICYETVFPEFVAASLNRVEESISNKSSVFVALSSNGWFGSSHQPFQHVMPSILRAIENRTPFIHVVNNGPSVVVNPAGEITFTSDFQTAGGFLAELSYAPLKPVHPTFYSQYPNAFVTMLRILFLVLLAWAILTGQSKLFQPTHAP